MKNLELKLNDEFKNFVVWRDQYDDPFNTENNGIAYRICFPEVGYGASVIKHYGSYGYEKDLWELALLTNRDGDGKWNLDYDEIVGWDVLGYLTDEQVNIVLKYISEGKVNENIHKSLYGDED